MKLANMNRRAERVSNYVKGYLSNRFNMPILIDDTTARVIAAGLIDGRSGNTVWLNGKEVQLQNVCLELHLVYLNDNMHSYEMKQKKQEIGYEGIIKLQA